MKSFSCMALFTVLAFANLSAPAQAATNSLAQAADKALAEGKDGSLNVGFARVLGLKTDRPLPLKRIRMAQDGGTNVLNVVRGNTDTIILMEHRQLLTTYYVSDRSGNLSKAVVNDGAVKDGGLTNLALKAAAGGFEKQKEIWSRVSAP